MTEQSIVWYDLDPLAGELWVVEGPDGHDPDKLNPDDLPDGFRWLEDGEWAARHQTMTIRVVGE